MKEHAPKPAQSPEQTEEGLKIEITTIEARIKEIDGEVVEAQIDTVQNRKAKVKALNKEKQQLHAQKTKKEAELKKIIENKEKEAEKPVIEVVEQAEKRQLLNEQIKSILENETDLSLLPEKLEEVLVGADDPGFNKDLFAKDIEHIKAVLTLTGDGDDVERNRHLQAISTKNKLKAKVTALYQSMKEKIVADHIEKNKLLPKQKESKVEQVKVIEEPVADQPDVLPAKSKSKINLPEPQTGTTTEKRKAVRKVVGNKKSEVELTDAQYKALKEVGTFGESNNVVEETTKDLEENKEEIPKIEFPGSLPAFLMDTNINEEFRNDYLDLVAKRDGATKAKEKIKMGIQIEKLIESSAIVDIEGLRAQDPVARMAYVEEINAQLDHVNEEFNSRTDDAPELASEIVLLSKMSRELEVFEAPEEAVPTEKIDPAPVDPYANLKIEKQQLEKALEKFKPGEAQYELIKERLEDVNKTIAGDKDVYGADKKVEAFADTEAEAWQKEKAEAAAQLKQTFDVYTFQMKAELKEKADKKWWQKLPGMPGRLLEELGVKKPKESARYKELREAYDLAKKRYGNVIANEKWMEFKDKLGEIPSHTEVIDKKGKVHYEKNAAFDDARAEVSKEVLYKVAIDQFNQLKAAQAEGMPPREKTFVKKAMEAYARQSLVKRAFISAIVTTGIATGVGLTAAPAALVFGSNFLRTAVLAPIAGFLGMNVRKAGEALAVGSKNKKFEKLKKDYSVVSGVNDFELIEQAFEQKQFRSKVLGLITTGAFSAAAGMQVRSAFAETGLVAPVTKTQFVPAAPQAPESPVAPIELERPDPVSPVPVDDSDVMNRYVNEQGVPAPAGTIGYTETPPVTGPSQGPQINPDPVNTPATSKAPGTFKTYEDDIRDTVGKNGRILKGDSAELSAKRIFEKNAEELGYKGTGSKVSIRKWAEGRVEAMVKDHPEIRNVVTHDGNKIIFEKQPDGTLMPKILKESGFMPRVNSAPIAAVTEESSNIAPEATLAKEVAAIKTEAQADYTDGAEVATPKSPALGGVEGARVVEDVSPNIEKEVPGELPSLPNDLSAAAPIPEVIPKVIAIDPETVAKAVTPELSKQLERIFEQKSRFFGIGKIPLVTDARWVGLSTIPAETMLKTDFTRVNIRNFLRYHGMHQGIEIDKDQLIKFQNLIKSDPRLIVPGMNVGSAVRTVIAEKIQGRMLKQVNG